MSAWTALAAIVLQLALSLGHIHADEVFPLCGSGGSEGFFVNAIAALLGEQAPTPKGDDSDSDHGNCAICASMAVLATGSLAAPPALVVPLATIVAIAVLLPDELALTPIRHLLFSTRAPPLS